MVDLVIGRGCGINLVNGNPRLVAARVAITNQSSNSVLDFDFQAPRISQTLGWPEIDIDTDTLSDTSLASVQTKPCKHRRIRRRVGQWARLIEPYFVMT